MFANTAVVFLTIVAAVSAFAPAGRRVASSAQTLKMGKYEASPGNTRPFDYFDPFSLAKDIDQSTFDFYRAAELKHGRVCMLAVIGYIVPEVFRFPGEVAPGLPFASVPNGIAAIEAIPALGWLQILFLIGYVDYALTTKGSAGAFTSKAGVREFATAEETLLETNKELNNGRLAMVATLELLRHDSQHLIGGMYPNDKLITGLPFLYGN